MRFFRRLLPVTVAISMGLIHTGTSLAACKGAPANQRFVIARQGTAVLDCASGYIWFRCSVGQGWDPATHRCVGEAYRASWRDVQDYATTVRTHGYVLPNQAQLAQLLSALQWYPRIDPAVFPGTPAGSYWTQEAVAAWKPEISVPPGMVDFSAGRAGENQMPPGSGFYLRYMLIPGSQEAVAAGFPAPGE